MSGGTIHVPDDVIFLVAQNIGNRKDLLSLSTCSRRCRAPAQKELFRHVKRTVKSQDWRPTIFPFLEHHSAVTSYIQHFTLRSDACNPNPGMDMSDFRCILNTLNGLLSLSIMSFDWYPSPTAVNPSYKHSSLARLALLGVTAVHSSTSPLDILSATDEWHEVQLESISHPAITTPPTFHPVSTHVLDILHHPLHHGSPTLPSNFHIFQEVVNLTTRSITRNHVEAIANVIRLSYKTLQSVNIKAVCFETFTGISDWDDVCTQLRSCPNLVKLVLNFSLPHEEEGLPHSLSVHRSLQALLTRNLVKSVQGPIKCLDIVLEIRSASKQDAVHNFLQLRWDAIGNELAYAKHLEVIRVRLLSFNDVLPRWYATQYKAVKDAFPQLSYHHMNAGASCIVFCKTAESVPRAMMLLCYTPTRPSDSCTLSL
ncbi:hypothetical protein NM688_g570 [Phlebia brevispora]|uniref:Uncharacterized protein n=1 Tax=Phlebia brevispora TaxID=194682 RepID=A0ACC1TDY5_9APHY|nr:hypothetical protein NM688_g570 [Phlebia brevispora]